MTKKQTADGYSHLDRNGRLEKISRYKKLFEQWQEDNPDRGFQDYYGYVIEQYLDQGHSHPTLGKNLIEGRVFGESGTGMLRRLIALGLKQNHICVDYGCGSLRVGCHVIAHLNSGCYWGLDVNERFLRDGQDLIGRDIIRRKSPNLHLISDEMLAQAHSAGPRFIFSKSVLLHIHPNELAIYFDSITRLMAKHTEVIIDVPESISFEVEFPVVDGDRIVNYPDSGTVFTPTVVADFTRTLRRIRIMVAPETAASIDEPERLLDLLATVQD